MVMAAQILQVDKYKCRIIPSTIPDMSSLRFSVIAAIDIGGTNTGYAFHFLDQDSREIHFLDWGPDSASKTKSCILFSPEKELFGCGPPAEAKYVELRKENAHRDWLYFQNFKKVLYAVNDNGTKATVRAENGRTMSAMKIFCPVIASIKEHLLQVCTELQRPISAWQVMWVLAIPVAAKGISSKFLRLAAKQAGIDDDQMLLIPDLEAVFGFAKTTIGDKTSNVFEPGSEFVICDVGGSTLDIASYEIKEDGELKMNMVRHSFKHGGSTFDAQYIPFLTDCISANVLHVYQQNYDVGMQELFRLFETQKQTLNFVPREQISFATPKGLQEMYAKLKKRGDVRPKPKYDQRKELTESSLTVGSEVGELYFRVPVENVLEFIKQFFRDSKTSFDGTFFIFAGGFSKSPYLRDAVRKRMKDLKFMMLEKAKEAVMVGCLFLAREREKRELLKSLPTEILRMNPQERSDFCTALHRGHKRSNDITVRIIAHVHVDVPAVIRRLIMAKETDLIKTHERTTVYIGRKKYSQKKGETNPVTSTFAFPAPGNWKSRKAEGKPILDITVTSPRYLQTASSYLTLHKNRSGFSDSVAEKRKTIEELTKDIEAEKIEETTKTDHQHVKVRPRDDADNVLPINIDVLGGHSDCMYIRQAALSFRSIFLIVFNLSVTSREKVEENDITASSPLRYPLVDFLIRWIHTICVFTKLDETQPVPKIVLLGVSTGKEIPMLVKARNDVIIRALQTHFENHPLRHRFILDPSLYVDVTDKYNDQFQKVRDLILETAEYMEKQREEKLPMRWVTLEEILTKKRKEGVQFMKYDELQQINMKAEECCLTDTELSLFLKYQHSLGNLMYYPDPDLKQYVLLDTKWVCSGFRVAAVPDEAEREQIEQLKKQKGTSGILLKNTVSKSFGRYRIKTYMINHAYILKMLLRTGMMAMPRLYDAEGLPVEPNYYIVPSQLADIPNIDFIEKNMQTKKAIVIAYRFTGEQIPQVVFHRFLAHVISTWPSVNKQGKPIMAYRFGAVKLDDVHRLIVYHKDPHVLTYICHRKENVMINPSVCRNVNTFVYSSLKRIFGIPIRVNFDPADHNAKEPGVTSSEKSDHSMDDLLDENVPFEIEVSTCNTLPPCFKDVKWLRDNEAWHCPKHNIGGNSASLLGVWFHVDEEFVVKEDKPCEEDCQGMKSFMYSKFPPEVILGRLARRISPEDVFKIVIQMGLTEKEARGIQKKHKNKAWLQSFYVLRHLFTKLKLTMGHLKNALDHLEINAHVLCKVWKLQATHDPQIPDDVLDDFISVKDIVEISMNLTQDVFPLAIELKLTSTEIEKLLTGSTESDPTSNTRAILMRWQKNSEFKPTYRLFSTSLDEVGLGSRCIINSLDDFPIDNL